MIDARELRLGNYVLDSGGKVLRIDFFEHLQSGYDCKFGQRMFLDSEEVHPVTDYTNSANPIPLTEQWLIDFGFGESKIDKSGLFSPCFKMMVQKDPVYGGFMFRYTIGEKSKGYATIKHVHQLQNLYFALAGEELPKK